MLTALTAISTAFSSLMAKVNKPFAFLAGAVVSYALHPLIALLVGALRLLLKL